MIFWDAIPPALGGGVAASVFSWALFAWVERRRQRRRARTRTTPWQAAPAAADLGWADRLVAQTGGVELLWGDKPSRIRRHGDPATGRCVLSFPIYGLPGLAVPWLSLTAAGLFIVAELLQIVRLVTFQNPAVPLELPIHAFVLGWMIVMVGLGCVYHRRHRPAQIILDDDRLYLRTQVGGAEEVSLCPCGAIEKVRSKTAPAGQAWMPLADIAFAAPESSLTVADLTGYHPGLNDGTVELLVQQVNGLLTSPPASALARSA